METLKIMFRNKFLLTKKPTFNQETTVAQGTIDMNKCNDVTYAESITDQKHSLCIYLPDQRYYIRGECREDIMK